MAVYTTVFAATSVELHAAFPGWRRPLDAPVRRKGVNPFTKQATTYDSWEPDDDGPPVTSDVTFPAREVVLLAGDYSAHLEARLPTGVRVLPHVAAKSVLSPHIDTLLAVVAGRPLVELRPALFPPKADGSEATLDLWPTEAAYVLAGIADSAKPALQRRIAAADWFIEEAWPLSDVSLLLDGLIRVATAARPLDRALFLLTEP